jgi:hypothetical protein
MAWIVDNGTTTYDFIDYSITNKMSGLNVCKILSAEDMSVGDEVSVKLDSDTIFKGIITAITNEEDGILKNYEIFESAFELKEMLVDDSGDFDVKISSDSVNDVVDLILDSSGWTRDSGSSDTSIISNVNFFYANKYDALMEILYNQLGYNVLFDSSTKKVIFNDDRNDYTSEGNLDYLTKYTNSNSASFNYDHIYVIGATRDLIGEYGAGSVIKVVSAPKATTQDEVDRIAEAVYNKYYNNSDNLQVILNPFDNKYMEGDKIQIDGTTYTIYDAQKDLSGVVLSLGRENLSAFNELLSGLSTSFNGVFSGVDNSWTGGYQNIDSTHDVTYKLNIADKAKYGSFNLYTTLSKYRSGTYFDSSKVGIDVDGLNIPADTRIGAVYGEASPYSGITTLQRTNSSYTWNLGNGGTAPDVTPPGWTSGFSHMFCTISGYVESGYVTTSTYGKCMVACAIYAKFDDDSSYSMRGIRSIVVDTSNIAGSEVLSYFTFTFPLPGSTGDDNYLYAYFTITQRSTSALASGDEFAILHITGVEYNVYGRHTHDAESAQNINYYENQNIYEESAYPSGTITIKVNGTTVGTATGGSATTIDSGDILSYLTNGENTITVSCSSGKGSVNTFGKYLNYGV